MPKAYSQDLRDRVIDAVTGGGQSRHGAAKRFGVSASCAIKWVQHYERNGSRRDRGTGGHWPSAVRQHRTWLLSQADAESSLTLHSLCERLLGEHGVRADPGILSRFFRAEGISFKESVLPAEQDRPDGARKRARWHRHQKRIDPRRLVLIDETWAKTNMIRTHGWGPRGQRVRDKTPHGHWKIRTGLRQAQDPAAQSLRTHCRENLAAHWRPARSVHPCRMRQLPKELRMRLNRVNLITICAR